MPPITKKDDDDEIMLLIEAIKTQVIAEMPSIFLIQYTEIPVEFTYTEY